MGRGRKRSNGPGGSTSNGFAEWGGYMAAKREKLSNQFNSLVQVKKISDLFQGVGILVNGLTNPSAEELKKLMAQHGGQYHLYPVADTTHIIASNLANVKINHYGSTPVVKPSWIVDSITMGKILNYQRYLLHTNQNNLQPALTFQPKPDQTTSKSPEEQREKISAKTASDPKFLQEFYNNSRLHLISTMGADFKKLITDLRDKSDGVFKGRAKLATLEKTLLTGPDSVIMHIDMDCFFVSVGLKTYPELKGKPIAVTHSRNGQVAQLSEERQEARKAEFALYREAYGTSLRSDASSSKVRDLEGNSSMAEIASCSYEARKCGVKNGMLMGVALKLCPNLKTIPYDFEGYKQVAHDLYNIVAQYTLDIEAVSCDEMYVDITEILKTTRISVETWASHIRKEITEHTSCPCSAGFGANRLQARLATRKAKPAGQFYLLTDDVQTYMSNIKLSDLPGVGPATISKLKELNLETCGQLQEKSLQFLQNKLGKKLGETIFDQANGIDKKPLVYEHERKSVSAEVNYGMRFKTLEECYNFIESLSVEVHKRLSETGLRSRNVTLKLLIRAAEAPKETAKFLGHGFCDSITRSVSLNAHISDSQTIFKEVKKIYDKLGYPFEDIRGIGIQLNRLEKAVAVNSVMSKFLVAPTLSEKQEKTISNKTANIKEGAVSPVKSAKAPQNLKGKLQKAANSSSAVSLKLFMQQNTLKSKPIKTVSNLNTQNIDWDIFDQLPEDLKNEIMETYTFEEKPSTSTTSNKIEQEGTTSKQLNEIEEDIKDETISTNPFIGLPSSLVKESLQNWVSSESSPNEVDINFVADYLKQLSLDRKIRKLLNFMNLLYRLLENDKNCNWHQVYYTIMNTVQEGMKLTYGGVLAAPKSFQCCKNM